MSRRRLLTDDEGGGDDSRRLLGLGPGRDLSDDGLIDLIREAYEVMEPVPQYVYDQASAFGAAHELRQGGIPVTALPDSASGGRAVMDDCARLPEIQTPAVPAYGRTDPASRAADGLHADWWAGAAGQAASPPVRGRRAVGVEAAAADRVGGRKTPSHWRNTAAARLKLAARIAAGLVAFAQAACWRGSSACSPGCSP